MTDAPTVGVEEEFLLVDGAGRLAPCGPEVTARPRRAEGELQNELARCQVESASGICERAEDVLAQLTDLRGHLAARAAEHGARLLPSGTPILREPFQPELTPRDRYRRMAEGFGAITHTTHTCGCHVHVAVPDRGTGVLVIAHLRSWLPVLLALSANSPFHFGEDTGHASWRHVLQSRWPSAGPPPRFDSLDHYEASVDAMLLAGAMLDRGMVYWDVRLSEQHPTVEIRVGDVAPTPREATLFAALVRAMVATALDRVDAGEAAPELPAEVLRANLWRAARDGLTGACLHPVSGALQPVRQQLEELAEELRPVLRRHGDDELTEQLLAGLGDGGAAVQRAAYQTTERFDEVIDTVVTRS